MANVCRGQDQPKDAPRLRPQGRALCLWGQCNHGAGAWQTEALGCHENQYHWETRSLGRWERVRHEVGHMSAKSRTRLSDWTTIAGRHVPVDRAAPEAAKALPRSPSQLWVGSEAAMDHIRAEPACVPNSDFWRNTEEQKLACPQG